MSVAFVKKELGSNIQQADQSLAALDRSAGRAGLLTFSYVCRPRLSRAKGESCSSNRVERRLLQQPLRILFLLSGESAVPKSGASDHKVGEIVFVEDVEHGAQSLVEDSR